MENETNLENRPKPFSKERTKEILCKIIWFYSVFFVVMKIMAMFQGAPVGPNAIISLPFIAFSIWGYRIEKTKTFNWIYVIVGILVISVLRYYEMEWIQLLAERL